VLNKAFKKIFITLLNHLIKPEKKGVAFKTQEFFKRIVLSESFQIWL